MLHHRTTNPADRAAHIADRLEREHERERFTQYLDDQMFYDQHHVRCGVRAPRWNNDWPYFWLNTYADVQRELIDPVLEEV